MARGGARNRSGPKPDEGSARSDARGYKLDALPAAGYDGPVPDFPLPDATGRELDLWAEVWSTPQACAWAMPSEHWRQRTVAMWVRLSARAEVADAPASLLAQLHRFADQIGMTTAGLAEMGWKISAGGAAVESAAVKPKREKTLREKAAAEAGWRVIDGDRAV